MRNLVLVLVSHLIMSNDAARILSVFPMPSISHQVVFRSLTQELVKRGHEVTVITPDPAFPKGQAPANLTQIDVHDISYKIWTDSFVSQEKKKSSVEEIESILTIFIAIIDAQLQDKAVRALIRNNKNKFDLLMIEACPRLALVFTHLFKAPAILVSSFSGIMYNYHAVGVPGHPFLYPDITRRKVNNLNLWEKITEMYIVYSMNNVFESSEVNENKFLKKHFGPNIPSLRELSNNIEMLFLNVHPIFEGVRPVPPSVVYMGGLHQKGEKELPKDLKMFLDSSKNGVIYVSFGTNVDPSLLPASKIETLVKVFSQQPYDILWKWNTDELPGRTENIRISKWLPQSDLLRHPKIKLFITQGGLQSTDEAITAGVPLIGIPMLGDQWFNVERHVALGIGVQLDIETLTEEKLKNAIDVVIGEKSYRRNIIKLRDIMQDQPQRPLERAVWWTEHVLRHGGAKHLRSPAANISWAQYLELELVLTLLAGSLTVILVLVVAVYCLYKYMVKNYVTTLKVKRN